MPNLYTEDEQDYFAAFSNPKLPLGYPVEGEEAEFYLSTDITEPPEIEEEE